MVELTRGGKTPLVLANPVMAAAGILGFDGLAYRDLLDMSKLGAWVTSPLSWKPRGVVRGVRLVSLPSGVLLHTGLPNPGLRRVLQRYAPAWRRSAAPVIAHVVASSAEAVARCAAALDEAEGVAALELGLHDRASSEEIVQIVRAALAHTQRPILVRVPLHRAVETAQAAEQAGAGGVVVAGPPRGTERDPLSGRLVGGRMYGPWLKAQTLRAVGQVVRAVGVPVTACGGVHSPDDARDYLEAGAVAVQVGTVTWVRPRMLEIIARNLGGLELTRATGALADEWEPGLGDTMLRERNRQQFPPSPPIPPPKPPDLPR